MRATLKGKLLLGAMISAALSSGAWAQDATDDEMVLEEVIVTATRVETSLMKTPIAVSAFDQDTLERSGVNNVKDLANLVPNMDISTINGQSTPIISMRGVRSTNETELGDPAVGVHLDGVYSPRMQGILALMFDNERVEVLRGPQGTLFGRNSTVGTINIITAKPNPEAFFARVNMAVGNYDAQEVQGTINIPVTDTFAVRASGRWMVRDSYLKGYYDPNQYETRLISKYIQGADVIATGSFDACNDERCLTRTQKENWWIDWTGGDNGWVGYDIRELVKADPGDFYNNIDEWGYRISAQWEPNEDLSLYFSYQQYRNDSAGGIDLINCEKLRGRAPLYTDGSEPGTYDCSDFMPHDDVYQAVVNVPGKLFLDINYYRALVDWNLSDTLTLKYFGGYEDQDRESAQDMEQSLNAWDGSMFFLDGTGSKSYSHELQLQSYGNDRFNWIAGANYFHEKTTTLGYYHNTISDVAFWDQPDRSTDAWSIFGQGTITLTDRLYMTLGYRHSDETKEDVGGRTLVCNAGNGCHPAEYFRESLNALPEDYFWDTSIYPEFSENTNKGSWDHDDWRIGLDYELNDNTLLYTYLATGFKSGGIGDVFHEIDPYTGEEINVRTTFGPEEVMTWELGAKSTMLEGKLKLQATYFFSDYEDMQYASVGSIATTHRWVAQQDEDDRPILDENGQPVYGWEVAPIIAYYTQNVPGAEIQGIEIEYDWLPYENGRLWGYFSWLDTEITDDWITKWNYDAVYYFNIVYEESVDPENQILETNLKGNELAVSPNFKFNLNYSHDFKFDSGTLVPWVNIHWEDDSYLTVWNVEKHLDDMDFAIDDAQSKYTDDKRDSFWTMNATLRFYRDNWFVELYGYNLTDEVVQYWGGAAENVPKGSFSVPRTYGLRFNYEFY